MTEKKCNNFVKDNFRAPPRALVFKWGKKLKLDFKTIKEINDNLLIRHRLGKIAPPPSHTHTHNPIQ